MAMKNAETLYVVADGGRARFIRFTENHQFRTVRVIESAHLHERSAELGRAPLSRVQESASPSRHGVEPRTDPHDRAERDFAKLIAETVNDDQTLGAFDALVLAAPSKVLAEVRGALSSKIAKKVTGEFAKDLTKVPDADLSKHLPRPSPIGFKA
jgi:protein required for attachment to host cells